MEGRWQDKQELQEDKLRQVCDSCETAAAAVVNTLMAVLDRYQLLHEIASGSKSCEFKKKKKR